MCIGGFCDQRETDGQNATSVGPLLSLELPAITVVSKPDVTLPMYIVKKCCSRPPDPGMKVICRDQRLKWSLALVRVRIRVQPYFKMVATFSIDFASHDSNRTR